MITWGSFSPKAIDFFQNSDARLNILHGSVRSSKTVNCTVRWLTFLIEGPPGDVAMLGKTMATLQRNVLNDLFDIVGPRGYKWVNRQQGELVILGRRVFCFGANNEEAEAKLRGATFAGAYCDEVSLYPASVFHQLMARCSVPGAQIFCNTNPDSPFHWFYVSYITNEEIQNKKVWHFDMDDNPNLDAEYVKSLKEMYTGVWYKRFIVGEWCVAEGLIYDMFQPEVHVLDAYQQLAKEKFPVRYLVGCDYGTSSVMTWGLYAKTIFGKYFKVKEYYYDAVKQKQQKTDGEFADLFTKWLGNIRPEVIYCDPSAASWKLELLKRGQNVQNADNDVVNGIRSVGKMIKNGEYFMDLSCANTVREYQTYSWDETSQLRGIDKPIKGNDHTCDADRYVLYTDSIYGLSGVYEQEG